MKKLLLCAIVLFTLNANDALARSSHSSSGSHSGKSKSGSHYVTRKCKTEACFKKHPSGSYGFTPGEHKK